MLAVKCVLRPPSAGWICPNNLIPKVLMPKHNIHYHLDIMRGSRVAMQINGAGGLQYLLHPDQPLGHIRQISRQSRLCILQLVN